MQCLKLITRPGCERIVRYAFEYARNNHRSKVTCMTKDNIMKLTDGLFHKVFDEIASEYQEIENEHLIVDIGTARLADTPEHFDVIVLPNLYGDILSDVAAQIAGSVGLAPSANIGDHGAMFEAIHGSAPMIAGQNIANPSGLLLSSVMMLVHIGQGSIAETVHNAWLRTVEDGLHTADMFTEGTSTRRVGTRGFARAVIERLGEVPKLLKPVRYAARQSNILTRASTPWKGKPPLKKDLVGVDVFMHWREGSPENLGAILKGLGNHSLQVLMVTNRGVKVWPNGLPETFCTDHWRCRFMHPEKAHISHRDIIELLDRLEGAGLDFIKAENLCNFDGVPGYALGQGQ
jgi:isocitrate dehydrogenase